MPSDLSAPYAAGFLAALAAPVRCAKTLRHGVLHAARLGAVLQIGGPGHSGVDSLYFSKTAERGRNAQRQKVENWRSEARVTRRVELEVRDPR